VGKSVGYVRLSDMSEPGEISSMSKFGRRPPAALALLALIAEQELAAGQKRTLRGGKRALRYGFEARNGLKRRRRNCKFAL